MNKSKKIELVSLLLSEDKELRILAINYLISINKKDFIARASWNFDTDNCYKMLSIVTSNFPSSYSYNILDFLIQIRENPECFSTQAILDLINLIIENNEIKNED